MYNRHCIGSGSRLNGGILIRLSLNYDDGDCTDVLPRRETMLLMRSVARGHVIEWRPCHCDGVAGAVAVSSKTLRVG